MARIEVTTHIEAPPARVWEVLVDWERQPVWMVDADRVTVLSPAREGAGVVVRAQTRLGGLSVRDDMEVTTWQEPSVIGVRHVGPVIRGVGAWELTGTAHGTKFTWWEELDLPLGALGELVGTLAVVPYVRRIFRASVAGLKRLCDGPGPGAASGAARA